MAYQYDVFISYKSKSREWLREIFLPPFQHFLEEEVGGNVEIFVDYHDIGTGDIWEQRLRKGLAHSKCLVSLLLPTYFESTWCKREFAVFEQRSQQQGMLSGEKPEGLIIPVSLHYVADRFPPTLKGMQIDFKYQDFYSPNIKGYRKLKKYQKLQDELKKLAETVARKIKEAPDWHADWQNDECLNPSTMHLEIPYFTIQQAKI